MYYLLFIIEYLLIVILLLDLGRSIFSNCCGALAQKTRPQQRTALPLSLCLWLFLVSDWERQCGGELCIKRPELFNGLDYQVADSGEDDNENERHSKK